MTQPADKLTEFSARWNDLRNAVIGRSAQRPANVPQDLYDRTSNTYARWRKYLAQMPAPMALLPTQALADWVVQYRELANEAQAHGLSFRVLPVGWTETMVTPAAADGGGVGWYTAALVAAAFALPLLFFAGGGKGRRRRRT
jgi:hypothetical protein